MGELEGSAQASGLVPNGLLPVDTAGVTRVLDADRWAEAEKRTAELIAQIQPTRPSEERRNAVANYVQRLIMKCFTCRVFTFGSVPLKTYLPDGDIDLTAMSENENLKDTWATKVRDILQSEERSANAEFRVKEVQYIQAEVKIIKCLVENIVVDISFNQVGGLCTLCFLDEIDHLISQSHLFKRSIILIKAWCYYESRILGAHHGLISTYALETLVLYIFHVFNNSFAGPLEVLYRFLEFFSNFDWDNFCVSLWGPLPISSLPDLTAEPPRKDSGELLLNEPFLRDCSTVYAVFPDGERQAQPFQSKHFNVIDPLRTNNNLGRSVSKGNFFRIRSAFSFGANRLRRLLDSPKENLIAELNQFFKNTWERHGSGHRPDAPSLRQLHLMPRKNVPAEESQISRGNAAIKENSKYDESQVGHEHQSDGDHFERNNIQQSANTYRINYVFVAPRSPSLRSHGSRMNSRDSDQFEIKSSSGEPVQPEEVQKSLPSDYCVSDHEGKGRFQFARTQSSPELTEASTEVLYRGTHSRAAETRVQHNVHTKSDNGNRGNNFNSDVSGGHSMRPFDDPLSLRRGSGHRSLVRIVDPDNLSSSYQDETSSRAMVEDPTSVSSSLDIHQEAQDLVNMMASPRLQNFNGPLQLPMPLASTHLPIPLPPVLASTGYTQSNLAGHGSANFSSVEPSWPQSMQFTHGFVSSPSQYFPTTGLNINHDDMVDSGNDSSGISDLKPLDVDPGTWHEHDAGSSTSGFDSDIAGFQMHHSEDMQPPDVLNYLPPSRGSNFGSSVMQIQHKFVRESRLPGRYDYTDAVNYQTTRGNNTNSNDRNTSLKFSPMSRASSRSQTSSGSSKDESGPKVFKPVREKWGTKATSSAVMSSMHGTAKNGREFDCSSENVSGQEDSDSRGWIPLSTMKTDMAERVVGSASLPFTHARNHQEPSQISEPGSMIPIPPFLVGTSRPRVVDNSGLVPFAFYPSPVPVLTMLPVYNLPSDAENYDRSGSQIDPGEREDQSHITLSDKSHVSVENYIPPEVLVSTTSSTDVAPELSVQPKSDILDSDFISHWKNLQFGRLCQNSHYHGQLIHPSPVMVPPMYLQGNFAWNGPGRPLSGNMITHVMGYAPQLVPVMPLQPGPNRSSGVFQRYGDDAPPRFRGGTGTFIPNTKANFRDRQFSNPRSQRGSYNYDRNEQSDRERSWISTKARASGRSHGRNQTEKPSSRLDRSVGAENRPYRVWDSYRRDPVTLHEVQNSSFGSSNLSHSSANMSNDMYPLPAVGSNGVSPTGHAMPSVVMLYPYDQGAGYGSPAEQLEFGSVGPMHLSSMSETSRPNDRNPLRETYQQMHGMYPRDSPRTPPDQPSSPRVQRSTVEWNHELNEEDFPPVISNSRR